MNGFIAKSKEQRRAICEQGEARIGLPAISLEKDLGVLDVKRALQNPSME